MRSLVVPVLIGVGLWLTSARPMAAGCVARPPAAALGEKREIFSGVARRIEDVAAGAVTVFEIERVWNSPRAWMGPYIRIYSVRSSTEAQWVQFTPGVRYIVVTRRLTEAEGEAFGTSQFSDPLGVGPCPDGTMVYDEAARQGMIAALGTGTSPFRPPRRIHDIAPVWPDEAQRAGVRGHVIVELIIDIQGNVSSARIVHGIPLLDEAALDCVRQWRYEPAIFADRVTPTVLTAVVTFGER